MASGVFLLVYLLLGLTFKGADYIGENTVSRRSYEESMSLRSPFMVNPNIPLNGAGPVVVIKMGTPVPMPMLLPVLPIKADGRLGDFIPI